MDGESRLSVRNPMRLVMQIAAVQENITVQGGDASAQITTEIGQNQSGNVADANTLDRRPMFDQDYMRRVAEKASALSLLLLSPCHLVRPSPW